MLIIDSLAGLKEGTLLSFTERIVGNIGVEVVVCIAVPVKGKSKWIAAVFNKLPHEKAKQNNHNNFFEKHYKKSVGFHILDFLNKS